MANEDSKSGRQQPEGERKFSQKQYDMLKRCSAKKDMTVWNDWRKEYPDEDVCLEEAKLNDYWLKGVNLSTHRQYGCKTPEIYMEKAQLNRAHLEGANLNFAHLENAELHKAYLEDAGLNFTHLEGVLILESHLENAKLRCAYLKKANLGNAHLESADLRDTNLEGANLSNAHLQGTQFRIAILSGSTSLCYCHVDRRTDFREVGLDSARIDPGTKQLLEYNIRRKNWEQRYRGKSKNKWIVNMHQLLTLPVRLFWCVSNYGLSTWRIIFTFFALAFVFALIYWLWPKCVLVNGIVDDIKGFVHALYFSVVTMTTLGFGDIAANPDSWKGQVLLMVQVILGYVLLGAMVTRFAVLFTSGGPAGKFSPTKTKETA
ncbi:MAG: pentapeptide repeat-containing protein [Sedimentisphaerales bacterium]